MQIQVTVEMEPLRLRLQHQRQSLAAQGEPLLKRATDELLQRVIALTPVDTGRLRRGWEAARAGLMGGNGAEGHVQVTREGPAVVVTATNEVPYAVAVEYGTSRQRGSAMVRRALRESRGLLVGHWLEALRSHHS